MFTFERCSLFMIYYKYCVTEWEKFGTEKKCSYFGGVHLLEVYCTTKCIYISSIDHSDKQRFIKCLTQRMNSVVPDNNLLTQSLHNLEPVDISLKPDNPSNVQDEVPTIPKPQHLISNAQLPLENSNCEISPLNTEQLSSDSKLSETSDTITANEPVSVYTTGSLDATISISNPNETEYLRSLSHQQLLSLVQVMCKDRNVRKKYRKTHDELFPTVTSPKPKRKRRNWWRK